jgi:hypothetical protein
LGLWYWKRSSCYWWRSLDGFRWTYRYGCWRNYNGCWNVWRSSYNSISKKGQGRVQSQASMDPDCSRCCRRSYCCPYCSRRRIDCSRNYKHCRKNRCSNWCICCWRRCCRRCLIGDKQCFNGIKTIW